MEFGEWNIYYKEILDDFGFSREDDEKCGQLLDEILAEEGCLTLEDLSKIVGFSDKFIVFGAGPSVKDHIKLLKEKSLSCEVVAITYGYSKSSVLSWLRIVDYDGYDGLYIRKKRESMKKIKKKANIAEDELKELYIKLEWLEAENALLKKVKALVEAEEARKRVNGRKPSKN